jgi:hypothetical protein
LVWFEKPDLTYFFQWILIFCILFIEFDLLETVHCPRIMAVFDGSYCAKVGLLFNPFLTPRFVQINFPLCQSLDILDLCYFCHWA